MKPVAAGHDMPNVYWLGGGSGAGKSTVARALAERHGLRLCSTDEAMKGHAGRCAPEASPHVQAFMGMGMDERWVHRSPTTMLETFHWFRGEGFELIVEDLMNMDARESVLVEGFRLLPELVAPLLGNRSHGIRLLPTPAFRRTAFESRGTPWSIAERTSDPERALANLLERDRLFTRRLRGDVERPGLPVIAVDGTIEQDVLTGRVEAHFGLSA